MFGGVTHVAREGRTRRNPRSLHWILEFRETSTFCRVIWEWTPKGPGTISDFSFGGSHLSAGSSHRESQPYIRILPALKQILGKGDAKRMRGARKTEVRGVPCLVASSELSVHSRATTLHAFLPAPSVQSFVLLFFMCLEHCSSWKFARKPREKQAEFVWGK